MDPFEFACRDPRSFEDFMRERFMDSRSEAAETIRQLEKDVSFMDAVALTIDALRWPTTKRLRRIVELYEPWCEWQNEWRRRGWSLRWEINPNYFTLLAPKSGPIFERRDEAPSDDVAAAASGFDRVKFEYIGDYSAMFYRA
jgi:hypothetical protein